MYFSGLLNQRGCQLAAILEYPFTRASKHSRATQFVLCHTAFVFLLKNNLMALLVVFQLSVLTLQRPGVICRPDRSIRPRVPVRPGRDEEEYYEPTQEIALPPGQMIVDILKFDDFQSLIHKHIIQPSQ